MKATQVLAQRLKSRIRFTTKDVAKGFYRGNKVGSLGAHTKHGHYLIDYRKVRHFVVPNLKTHFATQLTPFVTGKLYAYESLPIDRSGNTYDEKKLDGMQYLKWWSQDNPGEYDHALRVEEQAEELRQADTESKASPQT